MPNKRDLKTFRNQAKNARQKERERRNKIIARNKANYYAAERKHIEKQLKKLLRDVRGKGIYEPKADELTRYRKYRLNKIAQVFGNVFDPKEYAFITAPKKDRKKIIERASALEIKTTRTGLFVPKEKNNKVRLSYDKKHGEYYIKKSGRTKWGINQGRKYTTITPLASVDELEKEIDRLRSQAAKMGPLGKNDRLSFEIIESGNEGYSHTTFRSVELMLKHLENYRKTTAARLQFFRHIKIVKTSTEQWFSDHPVKAPKRFGRSIFTKMSPSGRKIN